LRGDYAVTARAPLAAQVKFADLQLVAAVEADPPHRVTRVRRFPLGSRIAGARTDASAPHAVGDVPAAAREIAAGAVLELGLPGLVVAGGGPDTAEWAIAQGWANLDRHEVLTSAHRFPACRVTRLITATAVLRLVADGEVSLNDPVSGRQHPSYPADRSLTVRDLLTQTGKVAASGYAALGQLIADVTGSPYPDAAARLVLEPLGMSDSSFPRSWPAAPDAVTGYQVNRDIAFTPAPPRVYAAQADGGMWTTAADLVQFGTRWSSLLPGNLAREALQPQAATGPGGLRIGLGWPIGQQGDMAGMMGGCPGAFASLLVSAREPRGRPMTSVALTNRQFPIVDVNVRLLRACGRR
jgi:CubicO group peptidase (beta-lactamase class C family)